MAKIRFDLRIVLDGSIITDSRKACKISGDQALADVIEAVPYLEPDAYIMADRVLMVTVTGNVPIYDIILVNVGHLLSIRSTLTITQAFQMVQITTGLQKQHEWKSVRWNFARYCKRRLIPLSSHLIFGRMLIRHLEDEFVSLLLPDTRLIDAHRKRFSEPLIDWSVPSGHVPAAVAVYTPPAEDAYSQMDLPEAPCLDPNGREVETADHDQNSEDEVASMVV